MCFCVLLWIVIEKKLRHGIILLDSKTDSSKENGDSFFPSTQISPTFIVVYGRSYYNFHLEKLQLDVKIYDKRVIYDEF